MEVLHTNEKFYIQITLSHFPGIMMHRLKTTPQGTKGREKGNVGMQLEQTTNVMRNALVEPQSQTTTQASNIKLFI